MAQDRFRTRWSSGIMTSEPSGKNIIAGQTPMNKRQRERGEWGTKEWIRFFKRKKKPVTLATKPWKDEP